MLRFVIVYSYIVIFAGWILNIFHFPPDMAKSVIIALDLIPFLLFAFFFRLRPRLLVLPDTVQFWRIVLLFFLCSLFTTMMHGGNVGEACKHFGLMFRYTPLASMLLFAKSSHRDLKTFIMHFTIISSILVGIGFIELIGGPGVAQYFMPITQEFSYINTIFDETKEMDLVGGFVFGIFPNTVDYSFFLLLSYIFLSNSQIKINRVFLALIYVIVIFFTGSKATLLIFILAVSLQLSKNKVWIKAFWGVVLLVGGILLYEFWEIFYWTVFIDSQSSRLGYIMFTLPDFLSEFSFDTFFGVSPDKQLAWGKINSYANAPMMTWNIEHMTSFEDEFYVALPVYYGMLGFLLLAVFYFKLYKALICLQFPDNLMRYQTIINSLFLCLLVAPLFNQITILRPFSLFFWIILGIIASRKQCNPVCLTKKENLYVEVRSNN